MAAQKKIGIIVGHPTQFEGPLFQYITKEKIVGLEVIYYDSKRMNNVYDPELKMDLNWGIDLLSGYEYFVVPEKYIFFWIKNKLKTGAYDLFIINGYNRLTLLYAIVLGKIYCKSIGLRLDTVEFTNNNSFKKFFKKILYRIFNKVFDQFFAIGTLTKKFLNSVGVPENKISIFSYVVDNDFFNKSSQLTLDEKLWLKGKLNIPVKAQVIVSVAKFSAREAPWDLLKAFSLIKDRNLHLLLVGDGPIRNELEEYANNNFKKQVTFTGYVKYPELPKYYGISDLFVHTSNNEPWGVSVQEAMASGLPIITSELVGSSVDLIKEGQNGFIYKTNNIKELKDKLFHALAINKIEVKKTNDMILENWSYTSTLNTLLKFL